LGRKIRQRLWIVIFLRHELDYRCFLQEHLDVLLCVRNLLHSDYVSIIWKNNVKLSQFKLQIQIELELSSVWNSNQYVPDRSSKWKIYWTCDSTSKGRGFSWWIVELYHTFYTKLN
jgi:hypothetical protein